jgi:hypothetical protein
LNHALIIVKFLVPRRATAQSVAPDSLIHFFATDVGAAPLIRIKAVRRALNMIGCAVQIIAFCRVVTFVVVHWRRRIQHGYVALGTIS